MLSSRLQSNEAEDVLIERLMTERERLREELDAEKDRCKKVQNESKTRLALTEREIVQLKAELEQSKVMPFLLEQCLKLAVRKRRIVRRSSAERRRRTRR